MRGVVIAVIVGVLAGMTATEALAGGPRVNRGREPNCLLVRSAGSKSISCRGVLAGLAPSAGVADTNSLPYDEFGLEANQPSQPRIGGGLSQSGLTVAGAAAPAGVADANSLPYDEFGLEANQPSQPRIGSGVPK